MKSFTVVNASMMLRVMCMCMPCCTMPARKCTCYRVNE